MYNLYEIRLNKIHRYFLSGRYMFLAENSIMEGPSASANSAIWCKFDDSSPVMGLPQHFTDREALLWELPCAPSSHANWDLSIKLVFQSGTLAETHSKLPKSFVKIVAVHLKSRLLSRCSLYHVNHHATKVQ